jgi:hypothetical protein
VDFRRSTTEIHARTMGWRPERLAAPGE